MKSQEEKKIKVGFSQIYVAFKDPSKNINKIENILERTNADMLVFPELALSGYEIENKKELKKYSHAADEEIFKGIIRISREKSMAVVFGFAEKEKSKIYNSSMLIDEKGKRYIYRKSHLFFREKILFDRGETGFFISKVKGAKVGMMICFDWFFPEAMRTLALAGAEIIAHPSNLVMPYCQFAMKTRCLENRVFAITSNRVGVEKKTKFTGKSQITGTKGEILAKADEGKERIRIVEINPYDAKNKKINKMNNIFDDRRKELYVL